MEFCLLARKDSSKDFASGGLLNSCNDAYQPQTQQSYQPQTSNNLTNQFKLLRLFNNLLLSRPYSGNDASATLGEPWMMATHTGGQVLMAEIRLRKIIVLRAATC